MGVAKGFARVLIRSARHRRDPQCAPELEPRQPRLVFLRMPFLELGVCIDDLRIFQKLVAEAVHHRCDCVDATDALVETTLSHASNQTDSILLNLLWHKTHTNIPMLLLSKAPCRSW